MCILTWEDISFGARTFVPIVFDLKNFSQSSLLKHDDGSDGKNELFLDDEVKFWQRKLPKFGF